LLSCTTTLSYHPFINPITNTADILSVNGIPKLVIANEDAVVAEANCTTVLSKRSKRCTELITDLILIVFFGEIQILQWILEQSLNIRRQQ
jgi:hypothetical protein